MLTASVLVSTFMISSYAENYDSDSKVDFISVESQEYIIDRLESKSGSVSVIIKSLDGNVLHRINTSGELIYVDGKGIHPISNSIKVASDAKEWNLGAKADNVVWGNWISNTETIPTGGLATAIIAGIIVSRCPYLIIQAPAIAAGVAAGSYSSISINIRQRYGQSSEFLHYERWTKIFSGNKNFGGPSFDAGKKFLN